MLLIRDPQVSKMLLKQVRKLLVVTFLLIFLIKEEKLGSGLTYKHKIDLQRSYQNFFDFVEFTVVNLGSAFDERSPSGVYQGQSNEDDTLG